MNRKLRILLLVAEPLRNDDGGGNTAINFFNGMEAEFAQIYCSDLLPDNDFCVKYFQISEREIVRNFLQRKEVGRTLSIKENISISDMTSSQNNYRFRGIKFVKKLRWNCFITFKNYMWLHSKWKTKSLEIFISEFNPDVIYAPCYASPFMLELTRWVKELTGKKVLAWSADDNYSLKQFSLSPFFWLNRLWVRKCLRKTYPYYDSFYSISEDEICQMESVVGQKMKILRKGIHLDEFSPKKTSVHQPIRLIYAGGIYIQRWKTLKRIGDVLRRINADGIKMRLDIYTQNQLTKRQYKALNDGKNIITHKTVDQVTLKRLYSESDIALHCESFALKNRLVTRLSFSTKIIDCLASGCAVMAIAWKEQTGLKYLKAQDAAICITDLCDLEETLRDIVNRPDTILEYACKARECGMNNHNIDMIQNELYQEFLRLCN